MIPSRQHLDEDEYVDVEEHEIDELVKLCYDGVLQDSKTVSAILAYKLKYCS